MKIRLRTLKRIINEEAITPPAGGGPSGIPPVNGGSGGGLGKLLDDVSTQFIAKMKAQFPTAEEAIQKEAADLKNALMATIKASATKIKMSAQPS